MLSRVGRWLGRALASYLAQPTHVHSANPVTPPERLLACLRPGDVLLVEGHSRFSTVIKYLTQSTWSHAALFVGAHLAEAGGEAGHCLVEADSVLGVRSVSIEEFRGMHTRICRPVGLNAAEVRQLTGHVIARIGQQYDLKNVFDLARYLFPVPPVPRRLRRRLLALGSGDPTRAICSSLIASAFQSIKYPLLPDTELLPALLPDCPDCLQEIHHIRHHSLFAPRDFDVSPYFQIVKPGLDGDFDHHRLRWAKPASDLERLPGGSSGTG